MIRGKKVNLVAAGPEYVEFYKKWINDPVVVDMLGVRNYPISAEREREWAERQLEPTDDRRQFTILTKRGRPIGNCGFNVIDYQNRFAVLGIMIGERELWDKGYGTDALEALVRFGFETLGLHKVCLTVDSVNARALACYKKCGFVVEAVLREHRFHRGKYCDELWMGILEDEWRARARSAPRAR